MQIKAPLSSVGRLKKIFNFRLWSDADRLKGFLFFIVNTVASFFVIKSNAVSESFAEARARLGLTDAVLMARKKALFRLSLLMFFLALLLLGYAMYQCLYATLLGSALTFSLMLLALVMAFRYHFWFFQIQQEKLGCSFKEWLKHGLLGVAR
jgi:intracellular multiplication protein IcmV